MRRRGIGLGRSAIHATTGKHTIAVIRALRWAKKAAVIITKHWVALTDKQIDDLRWLGAVVNTSTSGLDTDQGNSVTG